MLLLRLKFITKSLILLNYSSKSECSVAESKQSSNIVDSLSFNLASISFFKASSESLCNEFSEEEMSISESLSDEDCSLEEDDDKEDTD